MNINVITPSELLKDIAEKKDLVIVDIRENYEIENNGKLETSIHIPMGDLVTKLGTLKNAEKVIFHCNSGSRSENILNFMLMNNLYKNNYYNLQGGYMAIVDL